MDCLPPPPLISPFSAVKNTSFEEIRTQALFGKGRGDYMVTYMNTNTDDVHNKSSTVLSSKLVFRIVCCVFFSVALDVRSVSV